MVQFDSELVKGNAKLFIRRTLRGDFQKEQATTEERRLLAAARRPTLEPLAQNYVAWRRGALWLAVAALAVHFIFASIDWIRTISVDTEGFNLNPIQNSMASVGQTVVTLLYLRIPVTLVLISLAAWHWTELKRSRHWARFAWIILAGVPIVVSLIPFSSFVSTEGLGAVAEQAQVKMAVGASIGLVLLTKVAPVIVGVLFGCMRASLVLKTFLPESPSSGLGAVLFAPVYALIIMMLLVVVNQINGSIVLLLGLAGLLAGPVVYLLGAQHLVAPMPETDVSDRISKLRSRAALGTGVGVGLLLIFAINEFDVGFVSLVDIGTAFIAGSYTFMVAGADFLLALIHKMHLQSRVLHGTDLVARLEAKFSALDSVGLLKLKTESKTSMFAMPPISKDED